MPEEDIREGRYRLMEKKVTVSDAELEILEVLWSADAPLNAGEIRQEKREVYYYVPCIKREEYVKEETKHFVDKFFKGSSRNLAAALVNSEALTKEDLEELRNYFNQTMN